MPRAALALTLCALAGCQEYEVRRAYQQIRYCELLRRGVPKPTTS